MRISDSSVKAIRHMVLISLLTIPISADGTVQVYPPSVLEYSRPVNAAPHGCSLPRGGDVNAYNNCIAEMNRGFVEVYTKPETDGMNAELSAKIDGVTKDGGLVDQRVGAAEVRLKRNLVESVNGIPQRLLSDAAKAEIKAELQAEIHNEILEMRADLQKQIDELKRTKGR